MSTGDSADILSRVLKVLPHRWWKYTAPIRDAVLGGISDAAAASYAFYAYAALQTRLKTATGVWLDIASRDFLGITLPRKTSEPDSTFSARLIKEILRARVTRAGISQALLDLTGRAPQLMEMWSPGDVGAYDIGTSGYDVAGAYGDLSLNNQIFIVAYRPMGEGIINVPGYDNPATGYDASVSEYTDNSMIIAGVTDAEIYANVARTVAAGCTGWVAIQSQVNVTSSPRLVFNDVVNTQYLLFMFGAGL